ncbi:MAG: sigma-54-dependent Fis family transcriptional regulator [Chlamydiales bacterium]|nr:sigma-54-dependent Fis family transcriptional regulator [Chlamydiales bacterium]
MECEILLISRDALTSDFIQDNLSYPFCLVKDAQQALEKAKTSDLRACILDLSMPAGLAIFQEIRRIASHVPLILLSDQKAQNTQQLAEISISQLSKPVDLKALDALITQTQFTSVEDSLEIISESPAMKKILADVRKLAQSSASVFICGESGTGKEMIAKAVHYYSKRKTAPFIRVNCAALPETLIESELFGHEKGSFTGAHARRLGRFELADKGSLLLDEVTEIPLTLQSKLLRAIQEQEFERIGSMKSINVDVRIIATSNRDMKEAIKEKTFRDDLYYRLNVLPIYVPPLRDRKEDILPLAMHFLRRTSQKNGQSLKTLSMPAQEKLKSYPWPGNIRELGNVIEHAVIMSKADEITAAEILLETAVQSNPVELIGEMQRQMTFKEMEKLLIQQTLKAHNGNRTRSAKALGISIRTLRNKLKIYPNLE